MYEKNPYEGGTKIKAFDLSKTGLIKKFSYHNDTDIFIHNVGYNNFDFVKPIKWKHKQLGYTLHYVLRGSGTLFLGDRQFHITEKQLFFLPPNEEHMYYPDDDDKWKYIWFFFSGNKAALFGEEMGFSLDSPVRGAKDSERIEAALTQMMSDAENGTINQHSAKAAFYTLVGSLSAPESGEQLAKSCAAEAAQFLENNFVRSDFTVETLCSLLYVSHSALCKVFREEYGITPMKYLIQLRMTHASKLLSESDISVKDIAKLSGYKDDVHFMKTFKKYHGITATEYRQLILEKGNTK